MNFLEKNLEDIIFNNIDECRKRGLEAPNSEDTIVLRQFNMPPYGTADLIFITYAADGGDLSVRIIECKKDVIDMSAYMQVKRYVTGFRKLLPDWPNKRVNVFGHLIGSSVQTNGDFVFVINDDENLVVQTYSYGVDGIRFKDIGKNWSMTEQIKPNPALVAQISDMMKNEDQDFSDWFKEYEHQKRIQILEEGDDSLPLVITPKGVLLNPNIEDGKISPW